MMSITVSASPITFRVQGVPVPKARARVVTSATGKTHAFTPASTAEWEISVANAYRHAAGRREPFPAGVPLALHVEIIAPGSGPRGRIRGDVDNFIKGVADSLNGIAYADDTQIVQVSAYKRRAMRGEFPGAHVTLWQVEE